MKQAVQQAQVFDKFLAKVFPTMESTEEECPHTNMITAFASTAGKTSQTTL